MVAYTTPNTSWAWPTGNRLLDRLQLPRGLCVLTDGAGGWIVRENVWLGDLLNLTEGVDFFMGGHNYDVSDELFAVLPGGGGGSGGTGGGGTGGGGNPDIGYGVGGYGIGGYGE